MFLSYIIHTKKAEETFISDDYIYGIVYGDNFMGPYLPSNSSFKTQNHVVGKPLLLWLPDPPFSYELCKFGG